MNCVAVYVRYAMMLTRFCLLLSRIFVKLYYREAKNNHYSRTFTIVEEFCDELVLNMLLCCIVFLREDSLFN